MFLELTRLPKPRYIMTRSHMSLDSLFFGKAVPPAPSPQMRWAADHPFRGNEWKLSELSDVHGSASSNTPLAILQSPNASQHYTQKPEPPVYHQSWKGGRTSLHKRVFISFAALTARTSSHTLTLTPSRSPATYARTYKRIVYEDCQGSRFP